MNVQHSKPCTEDQYRLRHLLGRRNYVLLFVGVRTFTEHIQIQIPILELKWQFNCYWF